MKIFYHLNTSAFSQSVLCRTCLAAAFALLSVSALSAEEDITLKEPFYVNNMTFYMQEEPDADKAIGVTPIAEGVWGREFPDGFQFYNLKGQKISESRWQLPGVTATPEMTRHGVMLKKAGASSSDPYYLLKPDGSEVKLPANWIYPTPFVDDLAIVGIKEGFNINYKFINPDLKIVFPNLSPMPQRFNGRNYTIAPLSDGLRAYCVSKDYQTLWGFIDAAGKVVIEPQFTEVRSFHCERAFVKDKSGNRYFIDKTGKKAFEPKWDKYDDPSDYDSNLCATSGEKFDETDYYDVNGNKVGTLKRGTPFYKGKAYCTVFHEDVNKALVHTVDKNLGIGGVVNVTSADFNEPWYDALGMAHFTSMMADGGPCNGMYFFDYTLGAFSKEGLAPATMVTNDSKTVYKGFVDKAGHFVLVYEKRTK